MFKILFDKLSAGLGLLALLPLLLTISVLIKIKMPGGSVFFKQKRVGQKGKLFTIYKFRTMVVNHSGTSISVKGENRITPLGAVLRKYKLDELPELWNVLVGEMSFVGPRPDVPGYADKLPEEDRIVLSVKPGITGVASLKYRNEEEILALQSNPQEYNDKVLFPDKIRINKNYIKTATFLTDLQVIYCTILRKDIHKYY